MMKTKRRNLVQKNLKYTLGSFYFVGNKFLDCQLFNDVISLFHLCAPFKKTWNFLGVLIPVWELPTKLSLNSNDCIVFKLENLTPAYCYAWMMSTDHFFYRSTIYNELCQHSRSMVLQRLLSFQFLKWMISQNIIMKCTRVILRPQSNLYIYKVINASGFGRYLFILCSWFSVLIESFQLINSSLRHCAIIIGTRKDYIICKFICITFYTMSKFL